MPANRNMPGYDPRKAVPIRARKCPKWLSVSAAEQLSACLDLRTMTGVFPLRR